MKRDSLQKGVFTESIRRKSLMRKSHSQLLKIWGEMKIKDTLPKGSASKKKDIVEDIIYHEYPPQVLSFEEVIKRRSTKISMSIAFTLHENDDSSHSDMDLNDQTKSVIPMDDSSQSIERIQNTSAPHHDPACSSDIVLDNDDSKFAIDDQESEEETFDHLEVMSFERVLRDSGRFSSSLVDVLSKEDSKEDIEAAPSPKNSNLKSSVNDHSISRNDIFDQLARMSYGEEEILMAFQEVVDHQDINALVDRMESERQQ